MRKQFEMSDDQLERLMDASKPTRVMYLSGGALMGGTPQENANRAWKELGRELGFAWDTVLPISGKGAKFFTADALPESTDG